MYNDLKTWYECSYFDEDTILHFRGESVSSHESEAKAYSVGQLAYNLWQLWGVMTSSSFMTPLYAAVHEWKGNGEGMFDMNSCPVEYIISIAFAINGLLMWKDKTEAEWAALKVKYDANLREQSLDDEDWISDSGDSTSTTEDVDDEASLYQSDYDFDEYFGFAYSDVETDTEEQSMTEEEIITEEEPSIEETIYEEKPIAREDAPAQKDVIAQLQMELEAARNQVTALETRVARQEAITRRQMHVPYIKQSIFDVCTFKDSVPDQMLFPPPKPDMPAPVAPVVEVPIDSAKKSIIKRLSVLKGKAGVFTKKMLAKKEAIPQDVMPPMPEKQGKQGGRREQFSLALYTPRLETRRL
ncbi:hypothetical protein K402DRAFT_388373 [Aulographum hederae CBS 113979]|uniref:Uncharacterized protein n=1 Tax=Aulographum hederae CBS 113979 TaxID=1176131 RepID=A0A6G1HFN1_9PEZI|nr:hypothetical protein K402DRAFT_388373 [Aulographum hederae CBS 113979]